MADPQPVDMDKLDHDITEALAELNVARTCYDHSPNGDTQVGVQLAEAHLNRLLEFRFAAKPWLSREQTMPSGQAMAG